MTTGQAIAIGFAMFGAAALMALIVLASVALGAYIVYKTKREDGEMFSVASREGDAFVAQGELDDEEAPLGVETQRAMYEDALRGVTKQTERFLKQSKGPMGGVDVEK